MGFFGNKKQAPMPEASETIGLSLTPAVAAQAGLERREKRSGHRHDKDQVEYDRQATGKNTV